ncbi:uncharacterized protein PAC_12271 [Phialocephala subalpina]|uniref:SAP domain-containing protein n=1 Tax=Phialocephala subalpina TaxID=576137 RepID=A0A1L7XBG4_9HELO|nr:uncharacterized protein PAC_12271 [Phialocephala subalpina]
MEELAETKDWEPMKVGYLRNELKARNLSQKGLKETLLNRLKHTDGLPITCDGRKVYHESKAKVFQAAALEKVTVFPHFTRIPPEIREYIWEFSLPGPRVFKLPTSNGPICEHRLYFPKEGQPPNPAALSTCSESRFVALKRFKLCFGTTNIYADLSGGDMLYMSNPDITWKWTQTTKRAGQRRHSEPVKKVLCEDVVGDLDSVKHVILPATFWRRTSVPIMTTLADGTYTRNCLSKLKSLERVSLVIDPKFDTQRVFAGYCKHSDPFFQRPQLHLGTAPFEKDLESVLAQFDENSRRETFAEWKARRERVLGDTDAARFIAGFDLCHLSGDEIEKGLPDMRVVKLKHVPHMPRRVEEESRGYPLDWCCDGRDVQDHTSEDDTSEEEISKEEVSRTDQNQGRAPRTNSRYSLRRR